MTLGLIIVILKPYPYHAGHAYCLGAGFPVGILCGY